MIWACESSICLLCSLLPMLQLAKSDGFSLAPLERPVIPASPVGVEYETTPLGRTPQPPFKALYAWTLDQMPEVEAARRAFDGRPR